MFETININSLSDFLKTLPSESNNWAYPGQTKKWPLIPTLCRDKFLEVKEEIGQSWQSLEDELLWRFKQQSVPFLTQGPNYSKLEWLAIAQHHRLPTRLLDFTKSPLIALIFATDDVSDRDSDSVVWALKKTEWFNDERHPFSEDPLIEIDKNPNREAFYCLYKGIKNPRL